ncbi:early nodulin-like protein 18 [Ziziphus jujuba]|uniref:Early nodulin-like protein 18 n=1 Tax=Ziziphus jujuba TaxID=326968 RepID=A0A6P3ZX53_ZIZJJ|nr:early nodulin-like protein 18 [Ziziphus jujuba]
MKISSPMPTIIFFSSLVISLLVNIQPCQSSTLLVDGVSEWKHPVVHVGDSIIFKHKYHYNLYIFQNQKAYNVCNFTQATLLNKPNSTSYTWHPSRPGFFYFSFNNGSLKSTCQGYQKLAIKVVFSSSERSSSTISPQLPPMVAPTLAPAPSSGGSVISSSPAYMWPFRPRQAAAPPSPGPSSYPGGAVPSLVPDKGGGNGGIPFINSNPAVPLPTGEVDSATIRPLPTSGHGSQVMVELFAVQMGVFCVAFLVL